MYTHTLTYALISIFIYNHKKKKVNVLVSFDYYVSIEKMTVYNNYWKEKKKKANYFVKVERNKKYNSFFLLSRVYYTYMTNYFIIKILKNYYIRYN